MDIDNYINQLVSYQIDTWANFSKEVTIQSILNDIKNGTYEYDIDRLRNFINDNDLEAYKAEKLKLPAVTFCGTFNGNRRKELINTYNKIIVIDIDNLAQEEFLRTKDVLNNCEFVFSFWASPSNNGFKGLVALDFNFLITNKNLHVAHKSAFNKLKEYFTQFSIELDRSGSDTTRLCFVSYDPELILKTKLSCFQVTESDLKVVYTKYDEDEIISNKNKNAKRSDSFYNPLGKNKNIDRKEMKDFIKFITKKNISLADDYEDRYRIAYAIANTFTFDLGSIYFTTICRVDKNYNEHKANKLLEYCYENNNGFTKFGFIKELLIKNGYKKIEQSVS